MIVPFGFVFLMISPENFLALRRDPSILEAINYKSNKSMLLFICNWPTPITFETIGLCIAQK